MTIAVFVFSLLGAMALGMPIAYALLVCGVALMGYLALIGGLPAFDSQPFTNTRRKLGFHFSLDAKQPLP